MRHAGIDRLAVADASSTADRMSLEEFVRASSPILIPSIGIYGSAFILLIGLAHNIQPAPFGRVAAAVFLFLFMVAPAGAVQAAIATGAWSGRTSGDATRDRAVLASWRRLAPVAGTWMCVALIVAVGAAVLLHLPVRSLMLLLPAVLLSLLAAVPFGHLHAGAGPGRVALITLAPAAARVIVAVALVGAGVEALTAVLLSFVVAESTALGLAFWRNHAVPHSGRASSSERFFLGGSLQGILLATVGLALITTVDVLLARYRLPDASAGLYAGSAVIGRILLFIPGVAALLVMPELAPLRVTDPFLWLRRSLVVTGAGLLALWFGTTLFRRPLAEAMLGTHFAGAAATLPLLAAVGGLLAIVWQLSLFHKTVRSRSHSSNHLLAGLLVVLVLLFPATPDTIATVMLGMVGAALLFQYQGARAICRWSPPLSLLRPHEEISATPSLDRSEVELSLILPCRNAGPAVRGFLHDLIAHLEDLTSYEIVVVSDGSTDDTLEIAREFASPTVRVLHYPQGSGKGHALRVGLNKARGEYVGYIDSDGDIDPEAIGPFLALMKLYEADIVLGSKRHPMSQVNYPMLRRVMSWVYHKTARILFLVNVRDTQTGFKVIRREVLSAVLPRMLEKRYAFDLELLVVARLLGYRKVFEAPVRINYRFSSQIVPSTAFRILVDTVAIFYRRYILNTYYHAGDRLAVIPEDADQGPPLLQEM
jgi:O-antigen/teichoic acid export membrane protein